MIAIRDDDTAFWTTPQELEQVYGAYFKEGVKISLAVVPFSYKMNNPGNRKKFYIGDERRYVYENTELIDYLKPMVKSGQVEIMQHGFDHSYYIQIDNQIVILNEEARNKIGEITPEILIPECVYKSEEDIRKDLFRGKEILEDTFETKILTFVPPSNALKSNAVIEIERLGMNISGSMTPNFNRKKDLYGIQNYMKKILWKLSGNKISYPYVMNYKAHKELIGHSFTPTTNYKDFIIEYKKCVNIGCDYTLATHYWQINEDKTLKMNFDNFMKCYVDKRNSALLKDLF